MGGLDSNAVRGQVRDRYAAAAVKVLGGAASGGCSPASGECCGPGDVAEAEEGFGSQLYSVAERAELPADALAASLGCGNPLMVAGLKPGETVLDLGSGGGIDVLLLHSAIIRARKPSA